MTDFLLTEYQACISERKDIIRETNNLERNSLIALGVVWTWLFSQQTIDGNIKNVAWFIPAFIIIMSAFRVISLNKILESRESYLRKLEKKIANQEGMFQFYENSRKNRKNGKKKKTLLGISAYVYWVTILLVSLVVPIIQSL